MSDRETVAEVIQRAGEAEEIQSYEARLRWGSVLDQVGHGHRFIVSKRHHAIAMLVPVEEWRKLQESDYGNSPEARELAALVERLNVQNKETTSALDEAFAELAKTREALAYMRLEREQHIGAGI
ncbi:type II toxin-antitoxin system Phd/YefM family antitoxin [Halomonas alkalisoli]|uniref:type II toxin-antitoxin system Phd/YefM family antitoxin n=1 Tax=Halomonas alkalisoli TaxID=2907158 RepID=UPI001F1B3C52|nr:type II toxin-antitoxin system prevent-host-death family antitoxin [Halomonas alkalisoli]MCE9682352.1 type II toxin-antitoxin system prevent-host-death family antitoxin [Halomonas alkalisoli]